MGGDLGGLGRSPKKVGGDRPYIRPQIFGEVLLSDEGESPN